MVTTALNLSEMERRVKRLCNGLWDTLMRLSTVIWEVTAKEDIATATRLNEVAEILQRLYDSECVERGRR